MALALEMLSGVVALLMFHTNGCDVGIGAICLLSTMAFCQRL